MIHRYVRSARIGCLLLGCVILGCGEEAPTPSGEPAKITPAMDKMKAEMQKSLDASKTKPSGKSRASTPAPK